MHHKAFKFFNQADQSIQKGSYYTAFKSLKLAQFYGYSISEIHFLKSIIALKKLKINQALFHLQTHLSLSHKPNTWTYFYLGFIYSLNGNLNQSILFLKKSFSYSQEILVQAKSLLFLKKTQAYSNQKLAHITQKKLQYHLNIQPQSLRQQRTQALISFLLGKQDHAFSILNSIIQKKTKILDVYSELAHLYMISGQFQNLISLVNQYPHIENNDQTLLFLTAKAYYLNRQFSTSKKKLLTLIHQFPNNPKLYFNLANTCYHLKQYHRSAKFYFKSLDYQKNFHQSYFNLAVVHHKTGLLQHSQNLYLKASKINPSFFPTHYNLGFLFYQKKDYFSSLNSFVSSIQLNPHHPQSLHNFQTIKKIKLIDSSSQSDRQILSIFNFYLVLIASILLILLLFS